METQYRKQSFLSTLKLLPLDYLLKLDEQTIKQIQSECLHKSSFNQARNDVVKWVDSHKNPDVFLQINYVINLFKYIHSIIDPLEAVMDSKIEEAKHA